MKECIQKFDPRKHMNRGDFEVFHYYGAIPEEKEVHHHDFYEIYFLLRGSVSYWADGKTYHLKPGDMLLMNPMVLHRPIPQDNEAVYDRIVLWINKAYLEGISDDNVRLYSCFENPASNNIMVLHTTTNQHILFKKRLEALVRESYSDEFGSEIYAAGLLRQFIVELNRAVKSSAFDFEGFKESSPLVSGVLGFIDSHFSEELSLDILAREFFVSKYHLSHEFSNDMGISVYRYIMLKRLLAARQLLSEGLPAGEVCIKCGFRDYSNFYRSFKSEYGISPAEAHI